MKGLVVSGVSCIHPPPLIQKFMISIRSNVYTHTLTTREHVFGGGERNIIIKDAIPASATILLNFRQDGDLITLMMYVDALRRGGCKSIHLEIPYFPGARQDRVCNVGEAFSLKVYATLINAMGFDKVTVFDPHSDVTPALIKNVSIANNHTLVGDVLAILAKDGSINEFTLISPDAGSNKKIYSLAKHLTAEGYPLHSVVRADKLREMSTGKIIETIVYADDLTGQTCVIVDDICSYGGTFCALAVKLKELGAKAVHLITSHYEGVADMNRLRTAGINSVHTTDSKPVDSPPPVDLIYYDISNYLK